MESNRTEKFKEQNEIVRRELFKGEIHANGCDITLEVELGAWGV